MVALLTLLVVAGCGERSAPRGDTTGTEPSAPVPAPGDPSAPPALSAIPVLDQGVASTDLQLFHFLADDDSVVGRTAWSACLANGCWDGAPHLAGAVPSVGSPDELWFAFSYPGWDFEHVSFNPVDQECDGRVIDVAATKVGDRLFRIDPAGLAGEWRVDVFGYGREGGDAVASVLWTTPVDGVMPPPRATGSLFYDADGERVAYGGPTLGLVGLATTPRVANGTWTVTDGSGTTVSVPLTVEKHRCSRAGAVSFTGPELTPEQAASLRGRTLTYTVEVRLDRTIHTGTAEWTQRPSRPKEPELEFTFDPPLPAYTG